MNYELAKELKEAGFLPGRSGEAIILNNPEHVEWDEDDQTVTVIPWDRYILSPTEKYGETVYAPTLSELIEDCNRLNDFGKVITLVDLGEIKRAGYNRDDLPGGPVTVVFDGPSFEEAVAKLWLALNKHETRTQH